MASLISHSAVTLTVITFIMLLVVAMSSGSVSYCWSGSWQVERSLLNESCMTGATHLPTSLPRSLPGSPEPPPSPSPYPLASTSTTPQNLSTVRRIYGTGATPVQHCIVFKYLETKDLGEGTTEVTINTNFTCDHLQHCRSVGDSARLLVNVSYNGAWGDLYCCSQGNCNDPTVAVGLPPQQQLCFHSSNDTGTPQVRQAYCRRPSSQCSQLTTTQGHALRTQYFCDDTDICQQHGLQPSTELTCVQNKTEAGETKELCCCKGLLCNHPHPFSQPHPVQQPTILGAPGSGGDWRLVVGLVVALAVLLGVVVFLVISILRSRNKSRAQGQSRVLFTYCRIVTEDSAQSNVNLLT